MALSEGKFVLKIISWNFPGVWWSRLCTSTVGGAGGIPDQETKTLMLHGVASKKNPSHFLDTRNSTCLCSICLFYAFGSEDTNLRQIYQHYKH